MEESTSSSSSKVVHSPIAINSLDKNPTSLIKFSYLPETDNNILLENTSPPVEIENELIENHLIMANYEEISQVADSIPKLVDFKNQIDSYIYRIERLLNRVNPEQHPRFLNHIIDRFDNQGLELVRNLTEPITWETIRDLIQNTFSQIPNSTIAQRDLIETRQNPGETIREFGNRIEKKRQILEQALAKDFGLEAANVRARSVERAIFCFEMGLINKNISQRMYGQINDTLIQAIERAIEHENVVGPYEHNNFSTPNASNNFNQNYNPNPRLNKFCRICKMKNHSTDECRILEEFIRDRNMSRQNFNNQQARPSYRPMNFSGPINQTNQRTFRPIDTSNQFNRPPNNQNRSTPVSQFCNYCKKDNHTIENCIKRRLRNARPINSYYQVHPSENYNNQYYYNQSYNPNNQMRNTNHQSRPRRNRNGRARSNPSYQSQNSDNIVRPQNSNNNRSNSNVQPNRNSPTNNVMIHSNQNNTHLNSNQGN